jgi:hypothetical protein
VNKLVPAILFAVCLTASTAYCSDIEVLSESLQSGIADAAAIAAKGTADLKEKLKEREPHPVGEAETLPYPMPAPKPQEPVLQQPEIIEMEAVESLGALLGSFTLAERLDSHSDLFNLRLGGLDYDVSLASDPNFDAQYLAFRRDSTVILRKVKDANELRKKGVIVRLNDNTVYKFKVSINIFSPTRGSTLNITPESGTRGPKHKIKTGKILDAIEREAFRFKTNGKDFWLLYGTDVDPATGQLADSRSFLFIHEDGLSSKAWPVGEGRLTAGKALSVSLGNTKIALVKTLAGRLRIHQGNKTVPVMVPPSAPSAR